MAKKKRKKNGNKRIRTKIDIGQILLRNRQIFLFDSITSETAQRIFQQLIVLDKIKTAPIALYINSPGGYLTAGFSIIDAMKGLKSPIITFITGGACSMAGLISITGSKRVMSKTAVWMAHDVHSYHHDYATKIIDGVEFLKEEQKKIFDFLGKHTKLTKADLEKARNGELWLNAENCLKKGIVDIIV